MTCEHPQFRSKVAVNRLTEGEGGRVTGYSADVRIECAVCGLAFRFMGLAAGSHYAEPRVSADAIELRAPIEPAHVVEILGRPVRYGNA